MKLFWHIGPHKTGTTSIQQALMARFSAGESLYHYPETARFGPGHAEIAWRFLGLDGGEADAGAVLREIKTAEAKGFEKVVLSSEEFARALLTEGGFDSFARVAREVECELILTLSPARDRVLPELQEKIKHGKHFEFFDLDELLQLAHERPGLRADFVAAAVLGVEARLTSVIFVEKENPGKVYRTISEILGETVEVPTAPVLNPSLPFLRAAWFSDLNRAEPTLPWQDSRPIVDAAFAAATAVRPEVADLPYPPLPASFVTYVDDVWRSQRLFLDVMERAGVVRIF
jgi:hypothetical protein